MAENNGKVQKMRRVFWANFKFVCAQIWQTILVLYIGIFSVISFLWAIRLDYFLSDVAPEVSAFICIVFVVVMQVMAYTIWEDVLTRICGNYKFLFLAGFSFFLFVILGMAAFGIYMYHTCVFWWGDLLSIRILPPVLGLINFWWFAKFKVFND